MIESTFFLKDKDQSRLFPQLRKRYILASLIDQVSMIHLYEHGCMLLILIIENTFINPENRSFKRIRSRLKTNASHLCFYLLAVFWYGVH